MSFDENLPPITEVESLTEFEVNPFVSYSIEDREYNVLSDTHPDLRSLQVAYAELLSRAVKDQQLGTKIIDRIQTSNDLPLDSIISLITEELIEIIKNIENSDLLLEMIGKTLFGKSVPLCRNGIAEAISLGIHPERFTTKRFIHKYDDGTVGACLAKDSLARSLYTEVRKVRTYLLENNIIDPEYKFKVRTESGLLVCKLLKVHYGIES